MHSFDQHAFTDFMRIGCSDIFKVVGLDNVDAGCRWSWGQGWGESGVWVGGGVRGGDDGGRWSEFLHWAVFGISPVSSHWFSCEETVKAFRRA